MTESKVEHQTSASILYQVRRLVTIATLLPTKKNCQTGEHNFHLQNKLIITSSQGRGVKKRECDLSDPKNWCLPSFAGSNDQKVSEFAMFGKHPLVTCGARSQPKLLPAGCGLEKHGGVVGLGSKEWWRMVENASLIFLEWE